jgi:hypothetical protein
MVVQRSNYQASYDRSLVARPGLPPSIVAAASRATSNLMRITVEEAHRRWARGEPLVFVDSRAPAAWARSDQKLPGAIRILKDQVDQHAAALPRGRPIVTYCT